MTVNPRQSFKLKLCLWIFGISVVVFTVIFFACIHFIKIEAKADLDAIVNAKVDYAQLTLDKGLSTTIVASENLQGISHSPLIAHQRDSIFSLCEHYLLANPRLQGVCVGFDPNVVDGHEAGFCPYIMRSDSGFIRRNLADTKDYRSSDWYKVAHDSGEPYWSKPFRESNGTLITSYNVPLKNSEGKTYAVMAVDLNLNDLCDTLQSLRPFPHATLAVVDQDGTFVTHQNKEFIAKESLESLIKKADYAPNLDILKDIKAGKRGSSTYNTKDEKMYIYYAPVDKNGWTILLDVPRSDIAKGYDKMFQALLIDMLIGIVLLIIVCIIIINRLTKPLEDFASAARDISHGNFHVNLPVVSDHNELYDLRQALASMEVSLDNYINQLEESMKSKATIEGELKIARNIQMAMVPKIFPPYPNRTDIDIYASLTPAKAVGGDLYDFLLDGDDFYFCIGDVSGKGVPASLFMAITRSLFRNIATHTKSPAAIAKALNNAIAEGNEENMFVTMFIGRCNLITGEVTLCNCGHNAPATNGEIVDPKTMKVAPADKIHFIEHVPTNIPIGVFEGFDYQEITMNIASGVGIFLYTDGVTEAEDRKKNLYGDDRLLEQLTKCGHDSTSKEMVTTIVEDVHHHARLTEQSDDITVMCFKYRQNEVQKTTETDMKTLTINNKVEDIAALAPFLDEVSEAFEIAPDISFQLNLALDEALANSVNYAYQEGSNGTITLEAEKENNDIVFRLIDEGAPFDPTKEGDNVDTTLSAEDRPIGGLGIFLIKQMMTKVSYERIGGRNVLIMRKNIK